MSFCRVLGPQLTASDILQLTDSTAQPAGVSCRQIEQAVATLALLIAGSRGAPDTGHLLCHATRLLFQLTVFDTYFKVGMLFPLAPHLMARFHFWLLCFSARGLPTACSYFRETVATCQAEECDSLKMLKSATAKFRQHNNDLMWVTISSPGHEKGLLFGRRE
eukprot:1358985-Pyramimonas_sp.AAC.1